MTATKPEQLELGDCKQCGNPVVVAIQKGVPRSAYESEEFCSAACAKEFHGVPGPNLEGPKHRGGMIDHSVRLTTRQQPKEE